MGKISNSWDVTKTTFWVMKQDKELFLYPVFSSILSFCLVILLIVLGFIALFTGSGEALVMVFYGFIFVFYFGLALISTFFRTATSFTAATRFGGNNATVNSSMKFCFSHISTITSWALLEASVGIILKFLESLGRRGGIGRIIAYIISSILGLAWKVVTVFVIPVIVYENLKPFSAIKSSVEALKKTWGESLIRWAGVFVIKGITNIILFIILVIPSLLLFFTGSLVGAGIFFSLWLVLTVIANIVLGIANEVFNTALYAYAKYGAIPTGFNESHFKDSFKTY